jgi:hypothetical protein
MPARIAAQGLSTHPMLQKLVEAHLSGQSSRQIASWLVPTVAHTTISRYIAQHVAPVMGNAEALNKMLRANKDENKALPAPFQDVATQEQVQQLAVQAIVSAPALQIRANRIRAKEDRWRRVQMIVDGRAAEMKDEVPGGESGFLSRDYKGVGDSMTPVYKFDDALFKSFGDIEKDIAIELGQWQENTGVGQISIQIVLPRSGASPDAEPRISYASADAIDLEDGDAVVEIGLLQQKP